MNRSEYDQILLRHRLMEKLAAFPLATRAVAGGGSIAADLAGAGAQGIGKLIKRTLFGAEQNTGPYARALEDRARRMRQPVQYNTRRTVGDAAKDDAWKVVDEQTWKRLQDSGAYPAAYFRNDVRAPSGERLFHVRKTSHGGLVGSVQKHPGLWAGGALGGYFLLPEFSKNIQAYNADNVQAQPVYYQQGTY